MGKIYTANCDEKAATALQMQAMKYLYENPGATVGKLADELLMSSGAIAQLVERLSINEMITKSTDDGDHRITHLELSENGRKQLDTMKQQFFQKVNEILTLLPESDVKEMVRIQKTLLTKLEEREKKNV